MAVVTKKPDKVLGLHFFNPVPVMKLLEMVCTIATSDETKETSKKFGQSLGKTVIVAQDTPGFIVNRLLVPQLLNAIRMLETGVATKEDIDNGVTLGLNHPMGPLAVSDLVGLDTLLYIASSLYNEFKEAQYAPPILLAKMVTAGRLGRKTGEGFYEYKKRS
jgi:3-hydroxybutyryl-CoA dehydrogenase